VQPIQVLMTRKAAPGPSASIPSGTYSHYVVDPANATCTFQFSASGACAVSAGVEPSGPADWKGSVGVGSDYEISWDGGGAYEAFTSLRTVSRSVFGTASATYSIKIRYISTGLVLASGSITLEAIVDA